MKIMCSLFVFYNTSCTGFVVTQKKENMEDNNYEK